MIQIVGSSRATWLGDDSPERAWWIGKPWRRLELLVQETFWRGERVDRTWTVSATLGLRRLGWHFHVAVTRQLGQDYSEEQL